MHGDAYGVLHTLPAQSVHAIVTSPPYFLQRDYGTDGVSWPEVTFSPMAGLPAVTVPAWQGELGQEADPFAFIGHLVLIFREARRVLRDDGVALINLGDTFASDSKWGGKHAAKLHDHVGGYRKKTATALPDKNLVGIPWRFALAMQADGWILRSDIIWSRPNALPEPVNDRPTKSHEYIFQFVKQGRYFWDKEAIADPTVTLAGSVDARRVLHDLTGGPRAGLVPGEREQGGSRARVRPQFVRALELAEAHGLTEAHLSALRSVGMGAQPKRSQIQTGTHKNSDEVQQLADEAREALGSYAAEFLTGLTKNRRTVWTIPVEPCKESHSAVMASKLARDMILVSTPAQTCPHCRRPVSLTACGCQIGEPDAFEVIASPTGKRGAPDPSLQVGRSGFSRPRGENEGTRPMTRYEQRRYAEQLRASPYRAEMESQAGKEAFAHYLRKDRTGARAIPPELLSAWLDCGWLTPVTLPPAPTDSVAGVVLDPFLGSGTTYREALKLGRECIGIELKDDHVKLSKKRVGSVMQGLPLLGVGT